MEKEMAYGEIKNFGLERDTFDIDNIERSGDALIATVTVSYEPNTKVSMPLTKQVLKKALNNIPYIEELEVILNNKVDDLDNFVKALYIAHINYRAEYISSQADRLPEIIYTDPLEGESLEDYAKRHEEQTNEYTKIEFQIGWEFREELSQKPLTAEEFYDTIGDKRIANLWDEATCRWGWDMGDVWEITGDDSLEMMDFILHTTKFKRAVISMIMINFMDHVMSVFGVGVFDYELTVENIIALPEE